MMVLWFLLACPHLQQLGDYMYQTTSHIQFNEHVFLKKHPEV